MKSLFERTSQNFEMEMGSQVGMPAFVVVFLSSLKRHNKIYLK